MNQTYRHFSFILFAAIVIFTIFSYITYEKEEYTFSASDLQGQLGSKKAKSKYINNSDKKGYIIYGPYIELPKGDYEVKIFYSSSKAAGIKYDISVDGGINIVRKGQLNQNNTHTPLIKKIKVDETLINKKWEIRVWYNASGELSIDSITIVKTFDYIELENYLENFIIILLILIFFSYLYRYSKPITVFTSLLLLVISAFFLLGAYSNYSKYKELTYNDMPLTKDIFNYFLNQTLKAELATLKAKPYVEDNILDTYRLMVDQKELDKLDADLPFSGMEQYVDARLKINDDINTKVKLRYRGGSQWNYSFKRKSLKMKFTGDTSYKMDKVINLSKLYSPALYSEPISQKLAKQVGILAPNVKIIKMFINGNYAGLYLYLEQIDESFLRKNKLMPGSLYDGDYSYDKPVAVDEKGIPKLWYDSTLWEKKGARNAEQKAIKEDIELLIYAVKNYDVKDFRKFTETYFSDDYFKYLAFDIFTGTMHHDYYHNHKIYFDPYKGKYSPISWDIRFWMPNPIKDMSDNPFVQKIALDPYLDYKRDKELYKMLQEIPLSYIQKLIDNEKQNIAKPLSYDKEPRKINANQKLFPYKECLYPQQLIVANTQDIYNKLDGYLANITKRRTYLNKLLSNTEVYYHIQTEKTMVKLTLKVVGNSPIKLDNIDTLLYSAREIINKEITVALSGDTKVITTPKTYIINIPKSKFKKELFTTAINAVTGKKIIFKPLKNIDTKDAILLDTLNKPKTKTVVLKGTVEVTKTLEFDRFTNVIIKPNTTFIISPNQSIYFYSKVTALGTKENPIKFIPKDKTKPWGLVAVQGKATTGSKFHYCHFENGSVDIKNLIHYTSQFNIHNMDDFEVKNCFIGKNFIGDDAMHIAYSKGIVTNTIFDGARSDGLDIDISDVIITNNTFKNSGNDGLDIMTTTMKASNNTFLNTGDKGISVGEWSEANITNSSFTNTIIGIEIKDKSKVIASNLTFKDSKNLDINLYNKNKRYNQGGTLILNTKLKNLKIKADKRSKVTINE